MLFKFSLLAAALLNVSAYAAAEKSALRKVHQDRELQSCDSYDTSPRHTTGTTVFWTNGGQNSEWINKDNWQYDYLPGVHRYNKLIMAANDVVTVHCDATYMIANVSLEARSSATLDATANLTIGRELVLKSGAAVTQSSISHITIGNNLYLAATTSYSISDQAQLSIGLNLYTALNTKLTISGDSTTITASDETPSNSQIHGELKYVLGPSGTGTFDLQGELTISSTYAKLIIDAASYSAGDAIIQLIKYTSVIGSFSAANIEITGLAAGLVPQVMTESDGLYLELSSGSPTTADPTVHPTPSPTPTPVTDEPTKSPTPEPTKEPTKSPTPLPTNEPIEPQPTNDPTAQPTPLPTDPPIPQPTNVPTPEPTPAPSPAPTTKNPSVSPIVSPTFSPVESTPQPSDPHVSDPVTRIVLSESGFHPITSTDDCLAQDTDPVVIDGAAYTAGPATIRLYECTSIYAAYDLLKIRVENFQEGLWFEIVFNNGSVDLVIKSLTDYKEFWARVKNTFVGEYPESPSTAHFPTFSWETIPTWVRYRKNLNQYAFQDPELESIADNHHLSWYGLGTPDHVKDIAERIKFFNETHTTMLYWNAESYWGTSGVGIKDEYLSGLVGTGNRALYDYSNPNMVDWWVNHALNMISDENIDGVFTDNSLSPECDNGMCGVHGLETTDKSLMIRRLAEEVPANALDIGNYLRQYYDTGNRFRMAYADGSYFENQHKKTGNQPVHEGIVVSMQLAREASWKKKVVMWTGSRRNCGCGYNYLEKATDIPLACRGFNKVTEKPTLLLQQDLHKSLGEFLMIVEEFSYINFNISPDASCEPWRWDSSQMGIEEFTKPLGKPLGPPLRSGDIFSRHFEHLSVKVNIATEETEFIWKSE